MKHKLFLKVLSCFLLSFVFACSSDDDTTMIQEELEEEVVEEEEVEPEIPTEIVYPITGETGEILRYDSSLSKEGYVLFNDATEDRVYLMKKDSAQIIHEWQLEFGLGNDVELMSDGMLLASLGVESPDFSFGGFGGIIQLINPDSSIYWEYSLANVEHLIHHDVEMLPNGNVLAIVWDLRLPDELKAIGYLGNEERVYTESIIEINPATNETVWKWDSWDHIVQDVDDSKPYFGVVAENPQKIDINFIDVLREETGPDGDIMHANGLDYDPNTDLVYLSVNHFSEVWVIDHSATEEEILTDTGGNFGKGGDLVYRFGNPTAYDNMNGERLFYNNHFPNILKDGLPGAGNILVYGNGNGDSKQSVVYEFSLPAELNLSPNENNEPEVVWQYTRDNLYSAKVSGALRLENGNTLITSGSIGVIEVTNEKEVVWEFEGTGFYWRSYHYDLDSDALSFLNN
ncbi:aryl-sulfate sulfotransferase [Maribacter litoralis]|uniref:aryl-sulfate sulfotransferase n=1 Tax=Maribacter litoralis TaxID=2059726 RepID=UPI003F5CE2A5